MTTQHGFTLLEERQIEELNTHAQRWRHDKSGAELLSLQNDDENKVFGVNFRTPPNDSAGVAHIMEHSVLCGSRKYPLKEPFIELVKGSLNTFLNAMTYPDKTCYPVASTNLKDFYNLVDVYLDAVFHPRITPDILKQEGWHYELNDTNDPLIFKGVVFNEMKGVYSSPDSLMYRYSKSALFPDTTYHHDSGGDPSAIPDLTYEAFKSFHDNYYHPSNARLYFYGDDDPTERLQLLDAYLNEFEAKSVESSVALQPKWDEPRTATFFYDPGDKEDPKHMVALDWVLDESNDPVRTMLWGILSYILVSTPASPLRQALLESGLGEDLTGSGVSAELRQMTFSAGLKGVKEENIDKVEPFILDTLKKIADEGIDQEMVLAARNTLEFQLRENNTGSSPRGLVIMLRSLRTWLHDGDPFAPLAYESLLEKAEQALANNPRQFEEMIEEALLANTHRLKVVLSPKAGVQQEVDAVEKARLAEARQAYDDKGLQQLVEETKALKEMQETPDPPEALATIPSLTLDDIERESKEIPIEVSTLHEAEVLYHDLFTNGIVYLDLGFDMRNLPLDLLPYRALFGTALLEMGTKQRSYIKLAQRIRQKTGGIWPSSFTSTLQDGVNTTSWFFLRGKSTTAQLSEMLALLQEILCEARFDDQERFRQLVLEEKMGQESSIVPSGHSYANLRLRAQHNHAGWMSEQMSGLEYLFFLRQLAQDVDQDWPKVQSKLEAFRDALVNRSKMLCNVTLDRENWNKHQAQIGDFLAKLPAHEATPAALQTLLPAQSEGWTIPSQVNYVVKGANLYDLGYTYHGSAAVITRYLRTTWLWDKVRVQGGAYGGMCSFSRRNGVFTYLSYRDPNLLDTIDNYDQTPDFLRQLDISAQELERSVIGTIGDLDSYQLPDAKGFTSMLRHIMGEGPDVRQRIRDEILGTTPEHFRTFGDTLQQITEHGRVVVFGGKEKITDANTKREGLLTIRQAF